MFARNKKLSVTDTQTEQQQQQKAFVAQVEDNGGHTLSTARIFGSKSSQMFLHAHFHCRRAVQCMSQEPESRLKKIDTETFLQLNENV